MSHKYVRNDYVGAPDTNQKIIDAFREAEAKRPKPAVTTSEAVSKSHGVCAVCPLAWDDHTSSMKDACRDARAVDIARRPSVGDVAWLLEERSRLAQLAFDTNANLTRVQERSTEQTNEARGVRFFDDATPETAFRAIIGNAYAAVCKHGDFIPRLLHIADGTGGADTVAFRAIAQAECYAGERGDKPLTWRALVEEEIAEAFAETDPRKLTAELAQASAMLAAWMQAISMRGER